MCFKDLTRCFGSPEVDYPDRHHTSHEIKSHDETAPKQQKPPKSVHEGKHESPKGKPVDTDNGASDGYLSTFKSHPYPEDSDGSVAANSPRTDIDGETAPPKKASQVSGFPENRGANSYTHPQEIDSKEVHSSRYIGSSDDFSYGSRPYSKETKFSARPDDYSEERMQTKVGHKVIDSDGHFKANEQPIAIGSYGWNDKPLETKTNAKYLF